MIDDRGGAVRRRRAAVDRSIAPVRGFYKLFCAWLYQALCSQLTRETRDRLESVLGKGTPAWRLFLNKLPQSREDAAIGLSADLDNVLSLLSSGSCTEFKWLGPWARLYRTVPEARPLLAFAGLELAEAFRKVKEPCPEQYTKLAIETYHADEGDLVDCVTEQSRGALFCHRPSPTVLVGRLMIQRWLQGVRPSTQNGMFGPGAVAEQLDHVDRAVCAPSWTPVYRSSSREPFYFATREQWREWMLSHDSCEHPTPIHHSLSSRMVAVPKTATKPRLIAAEPAATSWRQQSLLRGLTAAMRRFSYLDITDQSHNQRLCSQGLATIDQSRASDRIADTLVQALFPEDWCEALEMTRTNTVQCLCGSTHTLNKFAGMGAATTFPVETLVFAACALSRAYVDGGGSPFDDRHSVEAWLDEQAKLDCWGFYGDDAVVPNDRFLASCDEYRNWGFIPNSAKSYAGNDDLRESCGVMYLNVHNQWIEIAPARFSSWPSGSTSVAQSTSVVATLNRIRLKIYFLTGEVVDCDSRIWTKIPRHAMFWDYSNAKGLLWSPKGLTWWDGSILPVTPAEYQSDWSRLGRYLVDGSSYQSTCSPDGEIPSSALYVCLSRVQGGMRFTDSSVDGNHITRRYEYPLEPSVLREPRPYKVVARVGHKRVSI